MRSSVGAAVVIAGATIACSGHGAGRAGTTPDPAYATASVVAGSPHLPLGPLDTLTFSTDEGTWMSVDVSPDGALLTFDLVGQIFTVTVQGGRARQLTFGPAFAERPKFSSDGRFIVFSSDEGGPIALWRVAVTGGTPERVPPADAAGFPVALEIRSGNVGYTLSPDTATIWAPDGHYGVRPSRRIVVGDGMQCRDSIPTSFILVDRVTGRERRLASAGSDCGGSAMPGSSFTPDGTGFITAYGGKLRRIAVPSGRTTVIPFRADVQLRVRPLVRFARRVPEDSIVRARRIEHPRVSPDGSRAVFSAFNRVWTVALPREGAPHDPPRRLTELDVGEYEPAWSPDGQYVAFVTWSDTAGGEGAIYRVRTDGRGAPERLMAAGRHFSQLAYTPDGQHLFAVLRPFRVLRNQQGRDDEAARTTSDVELVWLRSDDGTAATTPIFNPPPDQYQDRRRGFVPLSQPHFLKAHSDTVLYFIGLTPTGGLIAAFHKGLNFDGAVMATSVTAGGTFSNPETVLRVKVPWGYPARWGYNSVESVDNVVLSPAGTHALVLVNQRNLFLIEVPQRQGPFPLVVVLDTLSPHVRRITSLANGAEFPNWASDGRTFTYSFGSTLYRYDIGSADSLMRDSIAGAGSGIQATRSAYTPVAIDVAVAAPRDRPTGAIAFRNGRLITLRGDEVIERGDIVVRDRRIVAIGATGRIAIPSAAHVVDVTGRTIIPGLVDLHNHVAVFQGPRLSRVWEYEANLAYGVLTSRDPQAQFTDFLTYEDLLATGQLLGPRYMNTGKGIGTSSYDVISSMDDARAILRRYTEVYQVDGLKEYLLGRRDARQRLVMAAAARGLNVTSHGHHVVKQLVENAIDGYAGHEHSVDVYPLYADVRQLLARTGITLAHQKIRNTWVRSLAREIEPAERDHLRRWYPPDFDFVSDLRAEATEAGTAEPALYEMNWKYDTAMAQLAASGGRIAVGSHGDQPGLGAHLHLWAYAKGGMPPLEILRAGTLRGAEALGFDQDLGSLEVGKLADLVVLDRNPLENIRNTTSIRYIFFNGRLRETATLDELWPTPRKQSPHWWAGHSSRE